MHDVAAEHETPHSSPPGGEAVGSTSQARPFQRSAKVVGAGPTNDDPTAAHALNEGHETAHRELLDAGLAGLGVG
jgi:hypothetical protein